MQAQASHPQLPAALLAGTLDHLLRFLLNGCDHSAHRAAMLLDRLAADPGADGELRAICRRMSDHLEDQDV